MSSLGEHYSGIYKSSSLATVVKNIRAWLSSNAPGITLMYSNNDVSTTHGAVSSNTRMVFGLFSYAGEALGFALTLDMTYASSTVTLKNSVRLVHGYRLYTSEAGTTTTYTKPHISSLDGAEQSVLKCSEITTNSVTQYSLGAWYAATPGGGLLIGLYTDDGENKAFMPCPVYLGKAENTFLNEKLVLACSLNAGSHISNSGAAAHNISFAASTGVAMIVGESSIYPTVSERTYYKFYIQYAGTYTSTSKATPYTVTFAPMLCGFVSSSWCPVFRLDRFFCGTFNANSVPPLMSDIYPDNQLFVVVQANKNGCVGVLVSEDDGSEWS